MAAILNLAHKKFLKGVPIKKIPQGCQAGTLLILIQDSPEMKNPQKNFIIETKHALVQNGLLATGLIQCDIFFDKHVFFILYLHIIH